MNSVKSKISEKQLSNVNILVIGDTILDTYIQGSTERISPEAPVPVVNVTDTYSRLGGAGNVAANIACLSGQAKLISLVGNDEHGRLLLKLLSSKHVSLAPLKDDKYSTIVKTRVLCQGQQLLRLDYEETDIKADADALKSVSMEHINAADAVLLSDYNKGVLHNCEGLLKALKTAGKKIFVDPKGGNYKKYTGASVITPNEAELIEVVGCWHSEEELFLKAHKLRARLDLDALLLTRASDGMTLFDIEDGIEASFHIKAKAQEVFDVTGAGDTVVAVLALMHTAGLSMRESSLLANKAAGLVVGKSGAVQISFDDLSH